MSKVIRKLHPKISRKLFQKVYNAVTDIPAAILAKLGVYAIFMAATPDSDGVMELQTRGYGTPTSTHTSSIYEADWEGVYRLFAGGEPVWSGGRTARNELDYSEDISQISDWTATNATVNSATRVTFTAQYGLLIQTGISRPAGTTGVISFDARIISGNTNLNFRTFTGTYEALTLTNEWKRYSLNRTAVAAEISCFQVQDRNASNFAVLEVTNIQWENSTGQTDLTTPSEYIKTTTAAVQKTFCYENGNTVASSVVTEGTPTIVNINGFPVTIRGTILDPLPSLAYSPDATNAQIQSNDLTNVEWTATNVTPLQDAVGIDGTPNTACTLTATAANGTVIANAITAASETHSSPWHIKRKTGTGTIELSTDGGTTWQDITSSITSSFSRITVDQAAVTDPQIGIRIVTDTDEVIVGNAECHTAKTLAEVRGLPPIFTTSAPVAIDRTAYTFDILNHDNYQGAYFFEAAIERGDVEADIVEGKIISPGSGKFLTWNGTVDGWHNWDGTIYTSYLNPGIDQAEHKFGVVYSASEASKAIIYDGVSTTDDSYDGLFDMSPRADIDLFTASIYPQKIRNIMRYQGGTYTQLKAKIAELMA